MVEATQLLYPFTKRLSRLVPGSRNVLSFACGSSSHQRSPCLCHSRWVLQRCVPSGPVHIRIITWAKWNDPIITPTIQNNKPSSRLHSSQRSRCSPVKPSVSGFDGYGPLYARLIFRRLPIVQASPRDMGFGIVTIIDTRIIRQQHAQA